ncbi:MAG: helix-turn-helix domain-containing protein [Microbacterium sp.]
MTMDSVRSAPRSDSTPHSEEPLQTTAARLIRDARVAQKLTQSQLATRVGTSQSAINRIERGGQNLTLELLARINAALGNEILTLGQPSISQHIRVQGGRQLSGSITVNSSKNGAVALLCASLLNRGRTTLHRVARIVEVDRILDVLRSFGVSAVWSENGEDLEIRVPQQLDLSAINADAGRRTRSVIMFLGPLLGRHSEFSLPYAGGCDLGTRTVEPHMLALRRFGLSVEATTGWYRATVAEVGDDELHVVLTERGDTVTENAIMAAAGRDGVTVIRNASPNYMVQDLCFYLELLGIRIEGVGTTTLRIHGRSEIDEDVDYWPGEDPVEAMTLLTAGIVTGSEITVKRVPIEFMEIELGVLTEMELHYDLTPEYPGANGRTRLVDLTVHPSTMHAPVDKIHSMPFPGINIDNLPFFAVIAASAEGTTLIHDWVYEGRAIHLSDLTRLGADIRLRDPHRLDVTGPTRWSAADVICPPALRPAVVLLLAMLASKGTSVLRNIAVIERGYEGLWSRLNEIGAAITPFRD